MKSHAPSKLTERPLEQFDSDMLDSFAFATTNTKNQIAEDSKAIISLDNAYGIKPK